MLARPETEIVDLRHYVLLTEPAAEAKVEKRLADQGFDPFVPKEKKTEVRSRHSMFGVSRYKIEITRPVFRGYVFVPLNLAWSWGPFYSTPGLRQRPFLMLCDRPAVVNTVDMAKLKGLDLALQNPESHGLPYQIGDQVKILDGPFMDFVAKVSKLDDADRIELLMDILGGNAKTHVTASQIAPAD